MNPFQKVGIIACGTIFCAGVVTLITMQGVHILLAFLGVYLFAVIQMLGMQRTARENFELMEDPGFRRQQREYRAHRSRANGIRKLGQFTVHS